MKRCCYRHCKKGKVTLIRKTSQDVNISEDFTNTIDIREKRIGIIFKVIYVIALFFASSFMLVASESGKGLSLSYIMYICVTAFLLCLLLRMIVYIFNELKCLKIGGKDVPDKQMCKTEESYSRIFNYFVVGGIASISSAILLNFFRGNMTQDILIYIFSGSIIGGSVFGNMDIKKYVQILQSISSIFWTIAIIAMFAAIGLETPL